MSDSIQSISQGNYILQGTVATSAGIVGDGSTQNPLRADETVLFSASTPVSSCSFSESKNNFENLKFLIGPVGYEKWIEIPADKTQCAFIIPKGYSNAWIQWSITDIGETNMSVVGGKSFNFGSYTATAANYAVNTASPENLNIISQVLGINRISGTP